MVGSAEREAPMGSEAENQNEPDLTETEPAPVCVPRRGLGATPQDIFLGGAELRGAAGRQAFAPNCGTGLYGAWLG